MGSPSERTLSEPLHVIRLYDPNTAPLDAAGARLHGGRWNSPGADVVYAALTYAGAILETRVHANIRTPPPREIAVITIPAGRGASPSSRRRTFTAGMTPTRSRAGPPATHGSPHRARSR